jgi:3-oxoacyl-[acyl-carrier protein] reductase
MGDYSPPLANQTAVVTGASSGIGNAIATTFAELGANLIIHANTNQAGLEATAAEVRKFGRDVTILYADLTSADAQASLVEQAFQADEQINIWVNNAGRDVLTGEAADWSFEQKLAALWELDVQGTIGICRCLSKPMMNVGKQANAVILNMGWDQAAVGQSGDSGQLFGSTKSAVIGFSHSLARELAPHVRVNCLAPGWIQTAWGNSAPANWDKRAKAESLMGRWGTPQDVANVAVHLAAPTASFITGQTISINGGLSHEHIEPTANLDEKHNGE